MSDVKEVCCWKVRPPRNHMKAIFLWDIFTFFLILFSTFFIGQNLLTFGLNFLYCCPRPITFILLAIRKWSYPQRRLHYLASAIKLFAIVMLTLLFAVFYFVTLGKNAKDAKRQIGGFILIMVTFIIFSGLELYFTSIIKSYLSLMPAQERALNLK